VQKDFCNKIGTGLPNGDVCIHGEYWRVSGLPQTARSKRGNVLSVAGLPREGHMAIHIERREFMVSLGAAAAWPVVAWAQQRADRVRRIAWLGLGRSDEPSPYLDSLRTGLRDLGWIDGRNLTIGVFWASTSKRGTIP
jgi:hypothetical protein